MTGDNLEYLILALHSKILTYAFKSYYAGGGLGETGYRYKKAFIEKLPVPKPSDESVNNSKEWVKNSELDKIDDLLAKSFNLTEEESLYIYANIG